jgi:hypothetical protein
MKPLKLNYHYNNDKVKKLLEDHFNKSFSEISEDDVINKCTLWYSILLEIVNTDKDINFEVMKMQIYLKSVLWDNNENNIG